MHKILFLAVCLSFFSCDSKTFKQVMDTVNTTVLSDADIANGLKEALKVGTNSSVEKLSATDGYYKSVYKILLPEEARMVTDKLKIVPGFQNVEEEVIKRINKAAEDAAKTAGPIFYDAITQLTFTDVRNILMGEKNAATMYLNNKTNQQLYANFKPIVTTSLNKFGALDYWADAVNAYNKIPLIKKVNPDMADHVTNKALNGLFNLIEQKELGIRSDISQRTSDLLRKVFAKQDKP